MRRMLQSGEAATCEYNVAYDIVKVTADNFTARLTVTDHREIGSSWQLVYGYVDRGAVQLTNASGGDVLSLGSAEGAPVRIASTFDTNSPGQ
jgi:hypothetical protein